MRRYALFAAPLAAQAVSAHCPLCTAGIAAAAGGGLMIGIGAGPIGVFVGAFAVATSLMLIRFLPEKLRKRWVIGSAGLALTVLPILALVPDAYALYLPVGQYGTTVAINEFLIGSLIGAGLLAVAPLVSKRISDLRKAHIPYQGVAVTLTMLIVTATLMQVAL